MKYFLYGLILFLALMAPVDRLDVARLEPVEAVAIYRENGKVVLETDTKDKGWGETAQEALADMKRRSPSVIYLDTAQYLLVDVNAQEDAVMLREHLKPTVLVSGYGGGAVKDSANFARTHGKCLEMKQWCPQE